MNEWDTARVEACLDRIRTGGEAAQNEARNELFAGCQQRLLRLTRHMLRTRFPDVARWEETADVFQEVCGRLDRALRGTPVNSADHFFRLASENIRRQLLDTVKRIRGPQGTPHNHASPGWDADGSPVWPEPAADATLDWWAAFHEEVERLPEDERQVFSHLYYLGHTQEAAAELLKMSLSKVKRRWAEARVRLFERLGDDLPGDFTVSD